MDHERTLQARAGRRLLWLGVAHVLLTSSCTSGTVPDAGDVARVEVDPASVTLTVGQSSHVTARVIGVDGAVLPGRNVFWSSENPNVATVSQAGIVVAVSPGTVKVAASSGGKAGIATIVVRAVPVSLVRITPAIVSVLAGETTTLRAEAVDALGHELNVEAFAWTSSDVSVATVDDEGTVTGIAPGTATVKAAVDGMSGTAVVTVSRTPVASIEITPLPVTVTVGGTTRLTAVARDVSGAALPGRQITWRSGAPSITSVSDSGAVTGVSVGSAAVFASAESVIQEVPVTVTPVPIASVRVTPPSANLSVGGAQQLTGEPLDEVGNVLSGRPISWASSDETVATVSSSGLVQAISAESATITATSEGVSGSSRITVGVAAVASVTVTPSTLNLTAGQTGPLGATLKDANSNVLSGRVVTWSSTDPAVASVSSAGVVTGVAAGGATVTATSEGVSGTASVTVTQPSVASVTVTPGPTATVYVGGPYQQTFTAVARDASGKPLSAGAVSWTSSDPKVATVGSASGVVVGVGVGTATITATIQGVQGQSQATVALVPISSVDVSPGTATLTPLQLVQLAATPRDSAGNPITGGSLGGRTPSWTSSQPLVASVSASGTVSALLPGQANVTAQYGGGPPSGSATITVTLGIGSVDMSVAPADSLLPAATAAVTATPLDPTGTPVPLDDTRSLVWASSNAGVASVSQTGAVTAVAPGTVTISATVAPDNATGTLALRVLVPVASVKFQPGAMTMSRLSVQRVKVTATNAGGAPVAGRVCDVSTSDPSIFNVAPPKGSAGPTFSAPTDRHGRIDVDVWSAGVSNAATLSASCQGAAGTLPVTVR